MSFWNDCGRCGRHFRDDQGEGVCPQCLRALRAEGGLCKSCTSLRRRCARLEEENERLREKIKSLKRPAGSHDVSEFYKE